MKKQASQHGFVSIIMAMVIMIFVSLIALGFAFLARENASQNQNRLLSTQAFYAAESGVNDTVDFFTSQLQNGGAINPIENTNCNTLLPNNNTGNVGSTNPDIKYTCVLYNAAPTSLKRTVGTDDSEVVRVQSQDGSPIQSITISWQDSQGQKNFATNNNHYLPQVGFSGQASNFNLGDNLATQTGIVRATIIPFFGVTTRQDLTTKTQTLFLYPKGSNNANVVTNQPFIGTPAVDDSAQGVFSDGNCNTGSTPNYCNVKISGLSSALLSSNIFYVRLRGLYRSSDVVITASTANSATARLINDQAVVDVTGKADDVLRRIQVRVPLSGSATSSTTPQFAIETVDGLCKRLQVWPNGSNVVALPDGTTPTACKTN